MNIISKAVIAFSAICFVMLCYLFGWRAGKDAFLAAQERVAYNKQWQEIDSPNELRTYIFTQENKKFLVVEYGRQGVSVVEIKNERSSP